MRILVAGGTGRLGTRLVRRLVLEGHRVRVLTRHPERHAAAAHGVDLVRGDLTATVDPVVCDGIDVVFSCASASARLLDADDDTTFENVNHYGNVSLLRAALRAGVQKFVYLAPLGAERLAHTAYGGAHERFVQTLQRSTLPHVVVRPTAGFDYIREALLLLRAGHPWLFGESAQATNPIQEDDLAGFCVGALHADQVEVAVGGPRSFTRFEIARIARTALADAPPRYGVPARLDRPVLRRTNRRVRDLLEFGTAICGLDVIGPAHGTRDLERELRAFAGHAPPAPAVGEHSRPAGPPLLALDVQLI
ncbi:MAG TPA: NAD(P)H-binding protein [Longimicrobiales bacterium]|nr:NAD(P)H-binding protein [Longimicrobiales bacterium]